ncbi:MAG: protoporphyrinogen oxidase [Bacillus sp. (in: firmicutes)]|nr:protoporphyrinogen oxidase [Bacillus sp. (in: firmicutes)]
MFEEKQKVVIIGGGITGLSTAYYLQKHAADHNLPFEVKLIEATHRLGGKIQTVVKDGYVIERGPDSILERKKSVSRLAKEVGIDKELVNNSSGKSFVLANESLFPMPGGSIMGIPTELGPFITTRLFSVMGKMRAAADLIIPRSCAKEDQSLGHFFRRRLGDEVLENLIEPLLSGIYAGDIDRLSLMSTFPQFYQVEQKHRSLILGMRKSAAVESKNISNSSSKKGMFVTLSTGLQSLIEATEAKLLPNSVMKGFRVEAITKVGEVYEIELNSKEKIKADSVVVAVPHLTCASIFSQYEYFSVFKDVPATSVATVALAFPQDAIKKDIEGMGFVVSRNSDFTITACTWTHKKWPHTTPKGKVLIRCYVGRPGDETIVDLSDDEIINIVLDDLSKTMDITASPELSVVTRWKDSMPQYTVGHKARVETVNKHVEEELPGIFLAGSSYKGIGVPDCIDQAEEAVEKVLQYLKK